MVEDFGACDSCCFVCMPADIILWSYTASHIYFYPALLFIWSWHVCFIYDLHLWLCAHVFLMYMYIYIYIHFILLQGTMEDQFNSLRLSDTYICISKLTTNPWDNGLSPGQNQAIIWTNAGILLIGPVGTNFSEIFIKIHIFSFKKMHLKMSSVKCRPFLSRPQCSNWMVYLPPQWCRSLSCICTKLALAVEKYTGCKAAKMHCPMWHKIKMPYSLLSQGHTQYPVRKMTMSMG